MAKPQFEIRHINAGGFKTRYLEAGDRAKPALVLIHDGAFGTTAELCWGAILGDLALDYHVLAPELLGWGGTDKVAYFDRSPYAARIPHIEAFVRDVGIESADYVGASFGGSLIMRATVAPGNPWKIRRAISISGTGGPYRLQSGIVALADYTPSIEAATTLTELIAGSTVGLEDQIRQRHENSLIPGHWETLMAPRLKNPSVERAAPADDYLQCLAKTAVRSLLVEGLRDPLLEKGWAQKLADLSPLISAVTIDAGHEANIERPAEVVELIKTYLARSENA
ncbi:alpha/beta hydrolase [Bradyrhizobium sp. AS23.2]|uniref:alpha/beta fold hydrolase n=1 Tax=Bradyrhizobium sp. AS23.2 TaxID=1680155 RepID=UPI000AD785E6|nr:alpha/beta hydrolase [Bradyrhizobium sp. AS23.2]